jgi:hypothetical protein
VWFVTDAKPIRQFIGKRIAIVQKCTGLDDEPPRIRPWPPGHPADRRRACELGNDIDGAANMLALHAFRHGAIIDPAVAMADHLVIMPDESAGQIRILLQGARKQQKEA